MTQLIINFYLFFLGFLGILTNRRYFLIVIICTKVMLKSGILKKI